MTTSTLATDTWLDDWQDWRVRRLDETGAAHGIASLIGTTWLTARPVAVPGLPGEWSNQSGRAYGTDGAHAYALAVGQTGTFGDKLARVIAVRSAVALRVFDPAAASRTTLAAIAAFPADQRWRLTGRFEAAAAGSTRPIDHVDGARTDDAVAGIVRVEVGGYAAKLVAFPLPDGRLQISFADRTKGHTTAQFRFLNLPRPTSDGSVPVDFNRAYLSSCAFSDHYLCALPPEQNRLPIEVTAGETFVERHG